MAIYKFRSRYSDHDTSHLLPENQPAPTRSWWWKCIRFSCWSACSSRKRAFFSIILFLVLVVAGQNAPTIISFIDNQSQNQAHRQSYGYVDIPKWKWKSQQLHYKIIHNKDRTTDLPSPDQVAEWYDTNLQVDFSCPTAHLVANVWWLCNPRHLNRIPGCTIYSSGPPMGLVTEHELAALLPSCDIHVFDPLNGATTQNSASGQFQTIHVHPWGFANRTQFATNPLNNATMQLKTLQETRKELGHGRVDVLILHCGGCEWTLDYGDIQQVLVRVNGMQNANWFDDHWKQYALFHRQAVVVGGVLGRAQYLSYLKLRSTFFS